MTTQAELKTIKGDPAKDRYWTEVRAAEGGKLSVDTFISKDLARWPNIQKTLPTEHAESAIAQVAMTAEFTLGDALGAEMSQSADDLRYGWRATVDPKGKTPETIADAAMKAMDEALQKARTKLVEDRDKKPVFREGFHAPAFTLLPENPDGTQPQPQQSRSTAAKHTRC
jgi:hypothetical protein